MSMTPSDVAYFLEVARQQHFGRAARASGVTQPAITKAVRRLEDAVGVPLFERGSGGVRLTSSGQLFLEAARRFDLQHAELQRAALELRAQHAGLLRVGMTNPDGASPVMPVLSEMIRRRPALRVTLSIATSDLLNDAVERGELDVAVAPSYPGMSFSCSQLELGEDRVRVAARVGHPLFALPRLTLGDLAEHPWVMPSRQSSARRWVTQVMARAGSPTPRVALETEYVSSAVMGLVASTDLLAAVPVSVLQAWVGRVQALPLRELEIRRTLVLLTRAQSGWTPLTAEFRDLLIERRTPPEPAE